MYTEDEEKGFFSLSTGKSKDKSLLIYTCLLKIFYSMRIKGKTSEKIHFQKKFTRWDQSKLRKLTILMFSKLLHILKCVIFFYNYNVSKVLLAMFSALCFAVED